MKGEGINGYPNYGTSLPLYRNKEAAITMAMSRRPACKAVRGQDTYLQKAKASEALNKPVR